MKHLSLVAAAAFAVSAATAHAEDIILYSPDEAIDQARADCASYENGELSIEDWLLAEVDFDRDGNPEVVLDESAFSCSSAATMWCGTGGCSIRIFGLGDPYERLVKGWRTVEWGDSTVLLLQIHGGECGGDNTRRCYEAVSWSDGAFRSVRPANPG